MRGFPRCLTVPMVIALSIGITGLNTGCASDTETGVAVGGLLGGIAGAVIGKQVGGDRTSTAIGAGVGALAGAVIGSAIMEQRARELEEEMGNTSEVRHIPESRGENEVPYEMIVVSMTEDRGRVLFQAGEDSLSPRMANQLEPAVEFLRSHRDMNVAVVGHTDTSVPAQEQVDLSQRRADAVAMYFLSRGVSPERIVTRGAGAYAPLAFEDTASGRAKNRRVDLLFYVETEQPPEIQVAVKPAQDAEHTAVNTVIADDVQPSAEREVVQSGRPEEVSQVEPSMKSEVSEDEAVATIRPASDLAEMYTGTEEGRRKARTQQQQAAQAKQAPPVSPIRSASELLDQNGEEA